MTVRSGKHDHSRRNVFAAPGLGFIIWDLVQTQDRAVKLFQAYVFGAFVLAVGTLINFARGVQAADLVAEQGGVKYHDSRYSMLGVNENDLGLMIALSMPMALYFSSRRKNPQHKNPWMTSFCWIHIGTCFTALFLAGSRGGLIATVVGMLMFPLIMSRLQRWQRVAFVMICAVGTAVGIYLVPEVTWERLLSTETELSQGTLTHRTVLWDAGLQVFRDHPFLGVGAGAYGPAITKTVDVPLIAHNTFLSILVEQGVVGALFWLALLGCLFYCATRPQYAERCLWLIILLTWSVGVNSLTWSITIPPGSFSGCSPRMLTFVGVKPFLAASIGFQRPHNPRNYIHRMRSPAKGCQKGDRRFHELSIFMNYPFA